MCQEDGGGAGLGGQDEEGAVDWLGEEEQRVGDRRIGRSMAKRASWMSVTLKEEHVDFLLPGGGAGEPAV